MSTFPPAEFAHFVAQCYPTVLNTHASSVSYGIRVVPAENPPQRILQAVPASGTRAAYYGEQEYLIIRVYKQGVPVRVGGIGGMGQKDVNLDRETPESW